MAKVNWSIYFREIECTKEGIFCLNMADKVESRFSDDTQDDLFGLEDTSWWFKYRANVITQAARRYFDKDRLTFDLGGGNGYTTRCLQGKKFNIALLEPTAGACRNAVKRGVKKVICGTLTQDNAKDGSVEQMLLLDVLEHIKDDRGFLKMIHSKLASGGRVLLTVPAFPILWSSEDDAAGHYRRYRLEKINELAWDAGFNVLYMSYFFEFLFFPILFVRVGMEKAGILKRSNDRTIEDKRRIAQKQFRERKGIVQMVLRILENLECRRLLNNKKIRFGSSILCILEKKE